MTRHNEQTEYSTLIVTESILFCLLRAASPKKKYYKKMKIILGTSDLFQDGRHVPTR